MLNCTEEITVWVSVWCATPGTIVLYLEREERVECLSAGSGVDRGGEGSGEPLLAGVTGESGVEVEAGDGAMLW